MAFCDKRVRPIGNIFFGEVAFQQLEMSSSRNTTLYGGQSRNKQTSAKIKNINQTTKHPDGLDSIDSRIFGQRHVATAGVFVVETTLINFMFSLIYPVVVFSRGKKMFIKLRST